MHHLSVGSGRVPELAEVPPARLWPLLATAWEGEG
jgi:hypothetical protein